MVSFKLKSKINVSLSIKNQNFEIKRIYKSKGILNTDSIKCKVLGVVTKTIGQNMSPENLNTDYLH